MTAVAGSLIVAILALIVSIISVFFGWRNTSTASRSATAAEAQVSEARAAAFAAKESNEQASLMLLESARNRVNSEAPKPIVAIEDLSAPRMWSELDPTSNYQRTELSIPDEFDFWEYRWKEVVFVVHGLLINDGDEIMRVIPDPMFIEGETNLASGLIVKPARIHPNHDLYLLKPRSCALFEWNAGCTIDNWIDITNRDPNSIPVQAQFICFPGSNDGISVRVTLEIGSKVLYPVADKEDRWRVNKAKPIIYVNSERSYIKDTNRLRTELTGEFFDGVRFWPKD